ncbi:glyoxalase superfamily protein [Lacimonas salitolerans]|uniref:Glyoxalase superfamily protein n=1 Tax=Lacimonas salitolerans TaxID=1323750 RepID=A0ABW4EDE3_9RHOB
MTPTLSPPVPTRAQLKQQARRLRETMTQGGTPLSHAAALEALARQWGFRDWNTLSAAAPETSGPTPRWQIGQRVSGLYLGQPFAGRIKAVDQASGGFWRLVLVFDAPVDVIPFAGLSNLRRQVRCTVNGQGVTPEHTSDGQPHVVLHTD